MVLQPSFLEKKKKEKRRRNNKENDQKKKPTKVNKGERKSVEKKRQKHITRKRAIIKRTE